MESIFIFLTNSMTGSFYFAILGAFLWGVASILLSPCHLSSIPLIIGFINGQKDRSVKKAFNQSLLFSIGILTTIIIIGFITGFAGRMLGDIGSWGNTFLSIFFILFGLTLLDLISIPSFNNPNYSKFVNKGLLSSFIVGLVFGIGLGPCTFAFMAPILGVIFQVSSENFIFGLILLFAFAIGHVSIIVFAGTFTEKVEKYLKWNNKSKKTIILKKICGFLVIVAGLYNLKDYFI